LYVFFGLSEPWRIACGAFYKQAAAYSAVFSHEAIVQLLCGKRCGLTGTAYIFPPAEQPKHHDAPGDGTAGASRATETAAESGRDIATVIREAETVCLVKRPQHRLAARIPVPEIYQGQIGGDGLSAHV
jgi:hypothetical protein